MTNFKIVDELPEPEFSGQVVYVIPLSRPIERPDVFVALIRTSDERLWWYPVGNVPTRPATPKILPSAVPGIPDHP